MKRETFVSVLSAMLAEADDDLLREAKGLLFWRERDLLAVRVQTFAPGQEIEYIAKDGQSQLHGVIHHLNKLSVSVRRPHPTEGYETEVVHINRVIGLYTIQSVEEAFR